jgi:hypothetical protein
MSIKQLPNQLQLQGSEHIDRLKHFYTSVRFWGAAAIWHSQCDVASNKRKAWQKMASFNLAFLSMEAKDPALRLGSARRVKI